MDAHMTTTDLLIESEDDIRLHNDKSEDPEGKFETRKRQDNNSYYKTNSTKGLVIPTSCNVKYDTLFDSGLKVIPGKKSNQTTAKKSNRKSSGSRTRKQCSKWIYILCHI